MNATIKELRLVFTKFGLSRKKLKTKVDYFRRLKKECEHQIIILENKKIIDLYKKALKSGDAEVIALAEAMRHQKLNIKPDEEKLGYRISGMSDRYRDYMDYLHRESDQKKFAKETKKTLAQVEIMSEILRNLDYIDYVFRYTRYDNCTNGRFWRMS